MDEMRHIGPERLVAIHEVESIAKALRLDAHPERVDVVRCQLAVGAGRVQLAFEVVEGDLADHGVDHVLDLAGQEHLARRLVLCPGQQAAEGQHFAEDAGGLGQRQGRRGQHLALRGRQHLMNPVAKFMRQRHHVARLAEVVEHDIGVDLGHRRMGEGAGRLAGFHRGVDPAPLEERARDPRHLGGEGGIGTQHRVARLVPADGALFLDRQGRVAVPDLQPLQPQPFRLQPVVAVAEPRIGGDHGIAQRRDHLGLDMVGKVAAVLRIGHLAPAILDLLFLGQRVVNPREELDIALENLGQCARPGLAARAVGIAHQVQRRLEAEGLVLARDGEFQPGHGLVEKPVPGRGADHRLIMQEALQLVGELMRTHRPHPVEHRLVAGNLGGGGEDGFVSFVVDPVEFKREEYQWRGVVGDLVLAVGQELGAIGVERVLIIAQARIGHQPPGHRLDPLVAADAFQHRAGIEAGQLALIIAGKGGAFALQPAEIAGHFGRVGGGVDVGQVPFRQIAQTAGAGVGIEGGAGKADRHRATPAIE